MKQISRKVIFAFALLVPQFSWAEEATKVKTTPLSELAFYPEYSAPATVKSLNESTLSAELNARIIQMNANVGDQLKKGAILVSLECRDFKWAFQQVQAGMAGVIARHEFAEQRLKRMVRLQSQQSISDELLEQSQMEISGLQAELSAQEAAVSIARHNVSKCVIRAPFDAIVVSRLSGVGALASPGMPLLKVVDSKNLEVSAQVMVSQSALLQRSKQIEFRSSEQAYPLKLRAVVGIVEPLQRSREARLMFIKEQPLSGQSGRLVWKGNEAVIPADFLVERDGHLGLFIIENDMAKFHAVPDALEGRPLLVDLASDTLLITEGRFALNDGDRISQVK